MATVVTLLASGARHGVVDGLIRSGNYYKGDILEFVTDAINQASVADAESLSSVVVDATGLAIGDVVLGVAANAVAADPVHSAGLTITARVTDAAEITIDFQNDSGGALDPGSQTYRIIVMKAA